MIHEKRRMARDVAKMRLIMYVRQADRPSSMMRNSAKMAWITVMTPNGPMLRLMVTVVGMSIVYVVD